ncbi:DUF3159 domain-containing protein [Haloglycomyces albus]|uniref:DUF3159 domain-containing protein n=1 Tax=Haloglycomyces albus TaxID=526067 RepID=UPI0004A2A49B|nr:DUF3159 domain-containing protein [Haloglycomyces albus]
MTSQAKAVQQDTLISLLGGKDGAFDACAPLVIFIGTWFVSGESIAWATATALVGALTIAIRRLLQGAKPRAVIFGLLSIVIASLVVFYTNDPADILLPRILSNAASALVWAGFIVFRRPLLGLIVGGVLGQRTRWRHDPDLLRAYSCASWAWVAMYTARVLILTPFWSSSDDRFALLGGGVMQLVLSWPLLAACLLVSGWIITLVLPREHPGIRHPQAQNA